MSPCFGSNADGLQIESNWNFLLHLHVLFLFQLNKCFSLNSSPSSPVTHAARENWVWAVNKQALWPIVLTRVKGNKEM